MKEKRKRKVWFQCGNQAFGPRLPAPPTRRIARRNTVCKI